MHRCHTSVQPVSSFQAQTLRSSCCHPCRERWRQMSAPSVTAPTRGTCGSSARPCAPDTSAGRCGGRAARASVCWTLSRPGTFWATLGGAKCVRDFRWGIVKNCGSFCFSGSQRLQEKELDIFQNIHKNFGQKKNSPLNKCAIFTVSTLKSTIIYEMYFYNPH